MDGFFKEATAIGLLRGRGVTTESFFTSGLVPWAIAASAAKAHTVSRSRAILFIGMGGLSVCQVQTYWEWGTIATKPGTATQTIHGRSNLWLGGTRRP
jgi:hypothetical protein